MISHAAEQTAHRIKQGMTRAGIGASAGQQQAELAELPSLGDGLGDL